MAEGVRQVVIIEDDPDLLAALVRQFRQAGFGVFSARDGHEGLSRVLQVRPDLIVLDLIMPHMHGQEMLAKLYAEHAWTRRIPVLVLTNYDWREGILHGVAAAGGAITYMVKSNYALMEIVERAKKLVSNT